MTTRRRFLKRGLQGIAGRAAAPLLFLPLQSCVTAATLPDPDASADGDVLLGFYRPESLENEEDAIFQLLDQVDLGWLSPGDSVFIKVASNSPYSHPAVTSPIAVKAMVRALFDAGAGRVVVGDQAGVEHVRLVQGDVRRSSTRDVMERNGLLAAIVDSGAEPHFFDDHGFEEGYFAGTPPADTQWEVPIMVPNIIREVDHIVYLPRISSHALAGYTHGHKIAIGWLRDDCRVHLHTRALHFHKNFVDINYIEEIQSRLRLVLTYANKLMLDGGPDRGTIAEANPRIVAASTDLAHHDAVTAALIRFYEEVIPNDSDGINYGFYADMTNFIFTTAVVENATQIPFGSAWGYTSMTAHDYGQGLKEDRALRRAYELRGATPNAIRVVLDGDAPNPALHTSLLDYSDGLLST